MRFLDLFCGAGGSAMGMHRAYPDAEIIGIDERTQKHYPFTFVLGDALHPPFDLSQFDFIWASPPCQRYSAITTAKNNNHIHLDLIEPTRRLLKRSGGFYAIENVVRAPLINPLKLCGTMFGLHVIRHRLFETNPAIYFRPECQCKGQHTQIGGKHGFLGGTYQNKKEGLITVIGATYSLDVGSWAMDINWMNRMELSQAIPPAYSEYILKQLKLEAK